MINMKKTRLILTIITIMIGMSLATLTSAASVDPELWSLTPPLDAANECSQIGSGAGFAFKIDDWGDDMDGTYGHDMCTCEITITNSDSMTFDWECDPECNVSAVIVKAGTGQSANVFWYTPGETSDTGLYAPLNENTPKVDDTYEISHVTFCYDCPPELVIPETPIGTIGSILAMLGAVLLLRMRKTFF